MSEGSWPSGVRVSGRLRRCLRGAGVLCSGLVLASMITAGPAGARSSPPVPARTNGADHPGANDAHPSLALAIQQLKLTEPDGAVGDRFGGSVSVDGDTAMVGADGDDTSAGTDAGSAYTFVRSGTTWIQQAKLTASDGAPSDFFGFSVSVSGDT